MAGLREELAAERAERDRIADEFTDKAKAS
jgi:hypothetical protein